MKKKWKQFFEKEMGKKSEKKIEKNQICFKKN